MEFYVSDCVFGESGTLAIIGICGSLPVSAGVEFHSILRAKPRRYPDELELPMEIEACKAVHIRVAGVEMCGRVVPALPPHTSGVLWCDVHSVDLVPTGWMLTDRCESAR